MPNKITIHVIARELNLTSGKVSRAMNDHILISLTKIKLVKEKLTVLKYQLNKIISFLGGGRSHTIGVIIPGSTGVIKECKNGKIRMPVKWGVIDFVNENLGEHFSLSLASVDQQTAKLVKWCWDY